MLNKSNKVKWSTLKKMAEEQQLGNYNQPQNVHFLKGENPEQKSWTPQSAISRIWS